MAQSNQKLLLKRKSAVLHATHSMLEKCVEAIVLQKMRHAPTVLVYNVDFPH